MSQVRPTSRTSPTQPTLYDVSRLSGVSSATVSRVFSGKAPVSEAVRRRVMDAAQQLSYEPSHAARSLAGFSTMTIGAIFPEIASGFYADVLAGIDEVAAERKYDVLASFVGRTRSRSDMVRRLLRQGRVDALILLNLDDAADLSAESVETHPIILVDREITGASLPVIGMDNEGGAAAVVAHFCEEGHRRIGMLTGPAGNHDAEHRTRGFRDAMQRLGLPVHDHLLWTGDFTIESGVRAARQCLALSSNQRPDAVFCQNDLMAIGMLGEFQRSGLRVPGDIAVAGYDDIESAKHLQLTSVATPIRLMGQIAARWAIDLVEKNEKPTSQNLPVRLVVRHSSSRNQPRGNDRNGRGNA